MPIKVLLIDPQGEQSKPVWKDAAEHEEKGFDALCLVNDNIADLLPALEWGPDVIVSFGDWKQQAELSKLPASYHRRWLSVKRDATPEELGLGILSCFMGNIDSPPRPPISVFTAAYNNAPALLRAYGSLVEQTYNDWEWIIVDDSSDDGSVFRELSDSPVGRDPRVQIHYPHRRSGKIGYVKLMACSLCHGDFLVELDHDDILTEGCLQEVLSQFMQHPDVALVTTDCAEVDEKTGQSLRYPEGWGLGQGSYRTEVYRGKEYLVGQGPTLNPVTIRHIVGCPNHVRAWRRTAYWELGGHNPSLPVCDDYELMIRTWLRFPVLHSSFFGYIQYRNGGTETVNRNKEIQRLVRWISWHYSKAIDERATGSNQGGFRIVSGD